MNVKKTSLTHFILSTVWPYKIWIPIIALAGLIWASFNTCIPYVLKLIIDTVVVFQGNKVQLPKILQPYFFSYIALWIGLCVSIRLLDWAKMKFFPSVRENVIREMFNYLSLHSHQYFQNNFAGSLINKISDMQKGIISILSIVDELYVQLLVLFMAIITMLFIHPIFAAILLGWIVSFLLITMLFLKPIQRLSHALSESVTTLVGKKVDSIGNIINVRLFARHKEENHYIHQSILDTVTKDRAMQAKVIKMRLFWDFSILIFTGLNIYILLLMYSKDLITIGDFAFVVTVSISILWNLWFIAGQFVIFSEQVGNCKQALSILGKSHDIVDAKNAKPLLVTRGKIEFKEVTFHYNKGTYLFKNKNIIILPGQKVGLVGFSGSGKSTFVNLILRLFDVESGTIKIDDQSIKNVTQQSLREQIALIPQDITLFHRTLMENIRFGDMDAKDEEVIAISKKAHCHEFISQLKEGYQTVVGERGIKLSGGQRQRIAIARAMLKNSPILILDEATSALDSLTEQYIQEALDVMMHNKTTIVIAHRLSTLSKMDRILVFDKGEIIEDDCHEALLRLGGHYARLWHMQAGGFLP
ncbi:multidrug ABC transporter [Legionella jamestowniensis]|uniref:Multidrug ABC transporter n=1 Tax=Legionella jamestowniensis TaxID=455 RepID=A0ABX2XY55_9GAMM|nr:ABC transporter ATP-binding protein [Legionella jamestowniensis]OCH99146.1 multidrug ABC transporter [Legionella jamestowniensis]